MFQNTLALTVYNSLIAIYEHVIKIYTKTKIYRSFRIVSAFPPNSF